MSFINVLLFLAVVPLLAYLIWPMVSLKPKPRWADFLPSAAAGLLLLQVIVSGFQAVLLGLYLFSLVLFVASLPRLRGAAPRKPGRRGAAIARGLAGIALLGFCLAPTLMVAVGYRARVPGGPYAVGTVTYGWEDPARLESYTPDPADHRKIAVQFWYPADAGQDVRADGQAVENAPLSAAQPRYPVVVFSHGAFGLRVSNTTTYMELASRGYIVASIDHTYHAFITNFPDGERVLISQQFLGEVQANQSGQLSRAEDLAISAAWMDLRTADIRFTLDQIESLDAGDVASPLTGRIDLEKIGLFGHSLGGAASAAVCREDARCKAAIVIDATMLGEYDRAAQDGSLIDEPFPAPLMVFYNGDTYHATSEHVGYQPNLHAAENAAGLVFQVVVNGAQHLNFTDLPARAPGLARLLGQMMTVNGGTSGEIPQARCMEILDRYVVEFFDQALLGQRSELLAGPGTYPEVEFSASGSK